MGAKGDGDPFHRATKWLTGEKACTPSTTNSLGGNIRCTCVYRTRKSS